MTEAFPILLGNVRTLWVAYVPTTEGYAVMVSVADPNAFLSALRRATANR